MPDLSFADLYNLIFHLIFAVAYGVMIYLSLRGQKASFDVRLTMIPLAKPAAIIGGSLSLAIGLIMLGFWLYFMAAAEEALMGRQMARYLHIITELFVVGALIVSGIAMLVRWRHAVGLYLLATALLVTTTIFSLIYYGQQGHPFAMDIIALTFSALLTIAIGMSYTAQYFYLVRTQESEKKPPNDHAIKSFVRSSD